MPEGSDLYLVKSVLHDWPDERAVTILRHCLSDLNMLVNLGGRERTREEFAELCQSAGLALTSVAPLAEAAQYSLIEAVAG